MKTTSLTTLKINKISQAQYEAALAAGTVNENEFYIIPDANESTNANNIKIITIPVGRMRGDIDGDGKITENDSLLLERHIAKWEGYELTDETQLLCADFDADGTVNISDAAFIKYVANGSYKAGISSDILGNWNKNPNFDTEEGQFYTDVTIDGMTANNSASVLVKGVFENGFFTKAECIEGAIRIYAKLCPISTCQAVVTWGGGDGTAVIVTENKDLTIYNEHITNTDVHVTTDEKLAWSEKEIFMIHVTGTAGALSGDKTIYELIDAYNAGKTCIVVYNGAQYNLVSNPENDGIAPYARFMSILNNSLNSITVGNIGLSEEFGWEGGSTTTYTMLPSTSTSDSGKYLVVNESGEWDTKALEESIFIATYETTTFDELVAAYDSGKVIIVKYNGNIYQLASADTSMSFMFVSVAKNSEYVTYVECEFTGDWYFYNGKRFLPDAGIVNSQKILKVNSSGIPEWSDATVDDTLSTTSTNPVQNKIITTALNTKVDLSSAQSVAGEKTFSDDLTASANLNVGGDIIATGTITGSKVYNATWNDYAEWFEKNNTEEIFEPGDICVWFNNGVTKSSKACDKTVIGIASNTYGHILGGKELENMEDNNKEFVPIGLAGRVKCKVIGKVEIGDLIVTSNIPGAGIVNNEACLNQVIGKALENSNEDNLKQITILLI